MEVRTARRGATCWVAVAANGSVEARLRSPRLRSRRRGLRGCIRHAKMHRHPPPRNCAFAKAVARRSTDRESVRTERMSDFVHHQGQRLSDACVRWVLILCVSAWGWETQRRRLDATDPNDWILRPSCRVFSIGPVSGSINRPHASMKRAGPSMNLPRSRRTADGDRPYAIQLRTSVRNTGDQWRGTVRHSAPIAPTFRPSGTPRDAPHEKTPDPPCQQARQTGRGPLPKGTTNGPR